MATLLLLILNFKMKLQLKPKGSRIVAKVSQHCCTHTCETVDMATRTVHKQSLLKTHKGIRPSSTVVNYRRKSASKKQKGIGD